MREAAPLDGGTEAGAGGGDLGNLYPAPPVGGLEYLGRVGILRGLSMPKRGARRSLEAMAGMKDEVESRGDKEKLGKRR